MEGGTGLLITAREVAQAARARSVPPAEAPSSNVELLARIRDIADHAPAAVFVKDANGRYLFVNRWMRELLGLRRGAIIGRTVSDVMPPHLARAVEEHDRRVAAGQEVASEDTFPTPGGDRVLMAVRFPFPARRRLDGELRDRGRRHRPTPRRVRPARERGAVPAARAGDAADRLRARARREGRVRQPDLGHLLRARSRRHEGRGVGPGAPPRRPPRRARVPAPCPEAPLAPGRRAPVPGRRRQLSLVPEPPRAGLRGWPRGPAHRRRDGHRGSQARGGDPA